jgi:hypothetical protein
MLLPRLKPYPCVDPVPEKRPPVSRPGALGHASFSITLDTHSHAYVAWEARRERRTKYLVAVKGLRRQNRSPLGLCAFCRTLKSGGTRIRTGDTMIFRHMQKPLGMRQILIGRRIYVHGVPLDTSWFSPYCCATVDIRLFSLREAPEAKCLRGLGLGDALVHRLDDLLSEVQRVRFHASALPGAASSQSAVRRTSPPRDTDMAVSTVYSACSEERSLSQGLSDAERILMSSTALGGCTWRPVGRHRGERMATCMTGMCDHWCMSESRERWRTS